MQIDDADVPLQAAVGGTTKVRPPQLPPMTLPRRELLSLLGDWRQRRLTLVTAPAGYGKTTLGALFVKWIRETDSAVRTAWLTLDEDDNGPVEFVTLLTAAVADLIPAAARRVLPLLYRRQDRQERRALQLLLAALAELGAPVILVMDDYHRVRRPEVQALVKLILDRGPDALHLLLLSRHHVTFSVSKLRLAGQLQELDSQALRLTRPEIESFLVGMGQPLPDAKSIDMLEARTEGWVAGLQLAALSLHGSADLTNLLDHLRGDNLFLAEYLIEEVMEQQDAVLRDFLQECAILPRLCGDLCTAVTGRPDSADLLRRAVAEGLFVRALDARGEWFELHHLFQDLLQRRLRQSYSADRLAALSCAAAEWFLAREEVATAVQFFLRAGATTRALESVDARARAALYQNQMAEILRWVELLPDAELDRYPRLLLDSAWVTSLAILDGSHGARTARARAAVAAFPNAPQQWRDELVGLDLAQRIYSTDRTGLYADAKASLTQMEPSSHLARGWAYTVLALVVIDAGDEAGLAYAEAAIQEFARIGFTDVELMVTYVRVMLYFVSGQAARAFDDLQRCRRLMDQQARPDLGNESSYYEATGQILFWLDRVEEAEENFRGMLAVTQTMGKPADHSVAQLWLRLCAQVRGRAKPLTAAERREIDHVLRDSTPESVNRRGLIVYLLELIHLSRGAPSDVWGALAFLGIRLETLPLDTTLFNLLATLTPYVAAGRQLEELTAPLEELLARNRRSCMVYVTLHLELLMARQQQELGRVSRARMILRRALRDVETTGCVRILLMHAPLLPLLRAEESRFAQAMAVRMEHETSFGLLHQLTPQEERVFHLLVQGYRIADIAAELVLVEGTVKWHLGHIYAKLGVKNRVAALAMAREWRLFG